MTIDFDKEYAALVDEAALRQRIFITPFVVGQTPDVLKSLSQKSLPIVMPPTVIDKARKKHLISIDDIKTLPQQLRAPVMIFDSVTQPNSVNVLADFRNREGRPVTIAIHFDVPMASHRAHKVATISQRDQSQIELWTEKNLVRYVDREKQKTWFQYAGLQLPGDGITPNQNIHHKENFVNSPPLVVGAAALRIINEETLRKASFLGRKNAVAKAMQETEVRLTVRHDLPQETKARVAGFLNGPAAEKIWNSQTLTADGRIAAARVLAGEPDRENIIKDLPTIQHDIIKTIERTHGRERGRGAEME